jgi:hypothetical protein
MKKILLIAICVMFAIATQAQSNNNEVSFLQSAYGMTKKDLIANFMKVTDKESAGFWKVYDEYEVARKDYGQKRIDILTQYAKSYGNLNGEKATQLIKASLANQIVFSKLLDKTFKKMSKELNPVRAAQFVQAEMYLENAIRMGIADEIPMIGEFEKSQKK